ncbi:uncharacterized protein MONBRDRAFT_29130 [Monosiga brevicollis MX1]|uniref:Histidine biosynthesis trifunctional protein n=1 Tax=Monosiga brevicollis TaxID=81824 RepID=A9VA77_MONBE|nr:uncharacterized protein MONBRDRAFT_29130 [Monosiga brevicollis MX1]EDQ85680.1 predicted protein [Monosiga brevicollis MX1]|eukprot:XP_001749629.1 hypothetical protein [Monosiga brevicollis MX1]
MAPHGLEPIQAILPKISLERRQALSQAESQHLRLFGAYILAIADQAPIASLLTDASASVPERPANMQIWQPASNPAHARERDDAGIAAVVEFTSLETSESASAFLTSLLNTDREDQLWTTLVVDERGKALGVCYSNQESLCKAIEVQEGVYWSRRRGLWHKGLTSGATQTLQRINYDCDRDLLIFQVTQHGAGFCHRNLHSCFGERTGIALLESVLEDRKTNAPKGSYSQRLYNDPGLLKNKLVEEAIELSEADTADHVASEAADLVYFAMVKCVSAGVSFTDVERVLDRRHLKIKRRPGNAKPEFLKARLQAEQQDHVVEQTSVVEPTLRVIPSDDVPPLHRDPVDADARAIVEPIMHDIRERGEAALLEHAVRLRDIEVGQPHIYRQADLKKVYDELEAADRAMLDRTASRIRLFAQMQRQSVQDEAVLKIDGGRAGQLVAAVEVAGCYAPGGRYPLPSSVLMGAITARVAGVKQVWVASPRPHPSVLAAAYIAGADGLLAVGGAQAIAAFAYGAGEVPVCDAIVGPGNKFVTAAKSLVAGAVAIDMLAGPSECLVVADDTADPAVVAADLLAQSEHDVAARAILVTPSSTLIEAVNKEVQRQLSTLPTAETARVAVEKNSFAVHTASLEEAIEVSDRLAPEHLEVHTADAAALVPRFKHYGALFVGHMAAEVLGDYGAGPNHTLPTGGTARSFGGLSVHTFLRPRTFLELQDRASAEVIIQDAVDLALIEGLHGHSRAAALRLPSALKATNTKPVIAV